MGPSNLRPFLQSVCCNSPWNYAAFWNLKHHHGWVLVWEDCFWDVQKPINPMVHTFYLENSNDFLSSTANISWREGTPGEYSIERAVSEMSTASHVVGRGVVGQAALTGNAHWIYSDNILSDSTFVPDYPDELLLQFSAGIKTILLLPVMPHGVLQLGSVEMVADDSSLVAYLTDKFESDTISEYDYGYTIQHFSLTSGLIENSEESLPIFTENINEDHEVIPVSAEDCNSFGNPSIPMLRVQNFDDSDIRGGLTDTSGYAFDSEICWESLGIFLEAETRQQSFENTEYGVTGSTALKPLYLNESVSPFPSVHSIWTTCDDIVNEFMDFNSEKGDSAPISLRDDFLSVGFSLHNELEPDASDQKIPHYTYDLSISGQNMTCSSIHDEDHSYTVDILGVECRSFPIILEATVANACSNSDDNSSEKSNLASPDMPSKENKCSPIGEGDSGLWRFSPSGGNTTSHLSDPISSVESDNSTPVNDKRKQREKSRNSVQVLKVSRSSTINKKRACRNNERSRPRDRQLIQDRIKELRDLIPNSDKSSIDGLLDRTIKHMVFLRGVTDQADKLRLQDVKEIENCYVENRVVDLPKETKSYICSQEADEKMTKPAKGNKCNQNGRSWAMELGTEQQACPIVVKDLDDPGHMIIEMMCTDHDRFLEIADVIHRLHLTILRGVMEEKSDNSWARFIVQASGSFHRLDIFWPLMQLL